MCKPINKRNPNPYHTKDSFLFSDSYGYSLNIFRPANQNSLYLRVGQAKIYKYPDICDGLWHYTKISRKH